MSEMMNYSVDSNTAGTYLLASANPKRRAGRTKFNETRHPVFRGVRRRNGGKWVCEVRSNKSKSSRLWLGTYPTAEMAARAHDVAALAFQGRSACLNFADSAWRLPVPDSGRDTAIRTAAAAAAEAFRPREGEETLSCSSSSNEDAVSDAESSSGGKTVEEDLYAEDQSQISGRDDYLDEEAILFWPELLVDMAEGLMMSPPPIVFGDSLNYQHFGDSDVPIWSF